MIIVPYLIAIFALAILMVVHEGGHYLAARLFGMPVTRFSIGFGPRLYAYKPEGSHTIFQIALIPFLAYVQIAGMNPYEPHDPEDKGSYLNASLMGRMITVAAGPAANYLFASVLLFFGFLVGGRLTLDETSMRVSVAHHGPAYAADMRDGDKILEVDQEPVAHWDALQQAIRKHPGEPIDILIERGGEKRVLQVTPRPKGMPDEGKILIGPEQRMIPVGVGEALKISLIEPPRVVYGLVEGLVHIVTGKEKAELSGPVGIVREAAHAVRVGVGDTFKLLGIISAYLGGFNLLPIPALDGGRLLFLIFEAVARRKTNSKVEAHVHALGLVMMLALVVLVTWVEIMPKR
ncbi:M50 family metallopeptidase [Pajaroellobacter abortibovis]|uniref:PDZ domain-containing protein n=1 Tax=Pajaroellobacter abortibovis TaxID=1882918 RepID=A0A1L6MYR9_9BACT|nr:M50 family metallopeptidase [Pajaroellobacter abortibovis]APS00704.1 hypothetical protein BCY86_08450 [Pajaroellobacter abortibovis]